MPLHLTLLDPEALSPEVARVAGPDAPNKAKLMAARGLVPLGPVDLVTALYQLAQDSDAKVAEAAKDQVLKIPESVLGGALEAPLDPRVLDFFAGHVRSKGPLIERVILNTQTHNETILTLAGQVGERETEIIAGNAARLLVFPKIIEALYFNKSARMSTVQRLVEFAARNDLAISRIPQFDEMAAAILGTAKVADVQAIEEELEYFDDEGLDNVFNEVIADDYFGEEEGKEDWEEEEEEEDFGEDWEEEGFSDLDEDGDGDGYDDLNISMMPINAKIRLATLGTGQHRSLLVKDSNKLVCMAAISAPAVSETEASRYACDRSLHEDVIRFMTAKKEWQKSYLLKVNLITNPKTPLSYSVRMINHLRTNDLKLLSTSKNVPSVLNTAAKRLMRTRSGQNN